MRFPNRTSREALGAFTTPSCNRQQTAFAPMFRLLHINGPTKKANRAAAYFPPASIRLWYASRTRAAQTDGSSCSQTRRTVHPSAARRPSVSRSRARFFSTFAAQYSAFVFATVWCSGHPCQKQPSTNTARRARVNTRSAVRRTDRIGLIETLYRMPIAWTARRRASSGLVSRPLLDCMLRRVAGEEAQEPAEARRSERSVAERSVIDFCLADASGTGDGKPHDGRHATGFPMRLCSHSDHDLRINGSCSGTRL
jgi:hypothetical protein